MTEKARSFEEAIAELESIVARLEKGDLSLDESIENFQMGMELSRYCSKRLDEVERKITILMEGEQGELKEESFEQGMVDVNEL